MDTKLTLRFGFGALLSMSIMACGPGVGELGNLVFANNEEFAFENPRDQNFAIGDAFDFQITVASNADPSIVLSDALNTTTDKGDVLAIDSTTFIDNGNIDPEDDALNVLGSFLAPGKAQLQIFNGGTLLDLIDINAFQADDIEVEPVKFDAESGIQINTPIKMILNGDLPLVTELISDGVTGTLRGQLDGTVTSDNAAISLVTAQDFEIGQRFQGLLRLTPSVGLALQGDAVGAANIDLSSAGITRVKTLTVEVLDQFEFDINGVLQPTVDVEVGAPDPNTPTQSGLISARLTEIASGEEVFGGHFVFQEIVASTPLLLISNGGAGEINTFSDDFAIFTSLGTAGTALVEVSAVDGITGAVINQQVITINVAP